MLDGRMGNGWLVGWLDTSQTVLTTRAPVVLKNGEENGGKYWAKENIWSTEEKKNGEGKGGKCMEKENIFLDALASLKTMFKIKSVIK